jgi:S-DNA-T family DNA segregation ATPase FtsK/SpoIIIE
MSDADDFDACEDKASIIVGDDAILPAIEIAVNSGSVSTSLLQRKLSLGYARAARIVDKLEKIGVVGPFEGSKPRKVLITHEEFLEMRMTYEGTSED